MTERTNGNAHSEPADPVRMQTLWHRLLAIVEEQAQAIMRTAFCTIVRESGDLSTALYDLNGRMIAQAQTGTPGFLTTMADMMGHVLDAVPLETMAPGDSYITNDPWLNCGHLHDVSVVTPIFHDGRPIAIVASAAHVLDIGGRGLGPDAREIYEEGLRLPILPLARRGELDQNLLKLIRVNVRAADQVEGDILSLLGNNEFAARRLAATFAEFSIADIAPVADWIVERSRLAMEKGVNSLRKGQWTYEMVVDGYDQPLTLVALARVDEREITIDYTGTSGVTSFGINVPLNYSTAYTWFAIKALCAPDVPANAGSIAPIKVVAPANSVVNAMPPSPVAARHVVGHLLPDVIFGALQDAAPESAWAEGAASLWGPQFRGGALARRMAGESEDGLAAGDISRDFEAITVHSGGCGARPGRDGLSATAFPTNLRTVPTEIIEQGTPLRIWRHELRASSAGAGRWRGGYGQTLEIGTADNEPFIVSAVFDRINHPPRGRDGGLHGMAGRIALSDGTELKGKGVQLIPRGQRLILETPGGGGLGKPEERSSEAIADDIAAGLLGKEDAEAIYGAAQIASDG